MTGTADRKNKPANILAWCIAIFWLASAAAGPASQLKLTSDSTILAFGDSLTYGIGGSGTDYPQRLQNRLGIPIINAGSPGDTTLTGAGRFSRTLSRNKTQPDLIILCLGVNDFYRNVPLPAMRQSLLSILDKAATAEIPVLLVGVNGPGQRVANPLYAELADRDDVYLDNHSLVKVLNNPSWKTDLVHPNSEGYKVLADSLAKKIKALGWLVK